MIETGPIYCTKMRAYRKARIMRRTLIGMLRQKTFREHNKFHIIFVSLGSFKANCALDSKYLSGSWLFVNWPYVARIEMLWNLLHSWQTKQNYFVLEANAICYLYLPVCFVESQLWGVLCRLSTFWLQEALRKNKNSLEGADVRRTNKHEDICQDADLLDWTNGNKGHADHHKIKHRPAWKCIRRLVFNMDA